MSTVHISIGKKGGIGKTQSCIFLAQGLMLDNQKVGVIDLDPATSTISKYAGLDRIKINDMLESVSGDINWDRFDDLIEIANERNDLDHIIIDSGSSNCIQVFNYLKRNDAFELFKSEGHTPIIHTVIQGGDNQDETLSTLDEICETFPGTPKVIWINEYLHKFSFDGKGVEAITEVPQFKKAKSSIKAVFRLPYLLPQQELKVINKMNEMGILFSEVKGSKDFKIAEKNRVGIFAEKVLSQIPAGISQITSKTTAKKGETA